ncbi:MAG TPA: PAS domain-containing protein, partial [Acidimicrobiia bacterium]|nr:PAS domain-containing protein [Acidimicrobiia bacterium]
MGQATGGGSAHRTTARDDRALALLSSLQDVVLVRDAAGVLTYCSPSVFTALGYQPDELEGTAERDLIHTSDVD